jgi:hypothetical protein
MAGEKVRTHQPGQAVFKAIISDDIEWKSFEAFPPPVRLAVVVGEPSEESPYVIRVKVPRDVKLMPCDWASGTSLREPERRSAKR